MTLAEDSSMNQPVTFDPNTTVGLFPWEDSTFGATRSYHLNSASVASSNPFTQMMAPAMDARSEMSVEAKVDKCSRLPENLESKRGIVLTAFH